jgi:hypothetical protein
MQDDPESDRDSRQQYNRSDFWNFDLSNTFHTPPLSNSKVEGQKLRDNRQLFLTAQKLRNQATLTCSRSSKAA